MRLRDEDLAFVEWASKRHRWLWSLGVGSRRLRSKRCQMLAIRAAVALLRLDRLAWCAVGPSLPG